jgi:hypothetical protein
MIANLAELYNSTLAQGYSSKERQAVARALLRHEAHLDGTHHKSRTPDGLHPSYIGFNPVQPLKDRVSTKRAFVEASLDDLFDAVRASTPCAL